MLRLINDDLPENELDLTALRVVTDGDPVLEAELFGLFIETGKRCTHALETHIETSDKQPEWKEAAHELKGMAMHLGAERLRGLCQQAEDMRHADIAIRRNKLAEIHESFQKVANALQNERSG